MFLNIYPQKLKPRSQRDICITMFTAALFTKDMLLLLVSHFSPVYSVRPHRGQPTRLPRPWDSPGKNTGAGCHFLLQCMKVKSQSKDAQSCLTLSDPMDWSLPVSSVHGILQARILEWVAIAFSRGSSRSRDWTLVSCNAGRCFTLWATHIHTQIRNKKMMGEKLWRHWLCLCYIKAIFIFSLL